MYKRNLIGLLVMISSLLGQAHAEPVQVDSILYVLDKTVQDSQDYFTANEQRIQRMKEELLLCKDDTEKYHQTQKIQLAYSAVSFDSCLHYSKQALDLAKKIGNSRYITMSKAYFARLLVNNSFYMDGMQLLQHTDGTILTQDDQVRYYKIYHDVLRQVGFYSQFPEIKSDNFRKAELYGDSLLMACQPNSYLELDAKLNFLIEQGGGPEAFKVNRTLLDLCIMGTPEYSMHTYQRATLYQRTGDQDQVKYWLALSAISDIRCGRYDHASLWMLAEILRQENQPARAYKYITFSWEMTKQYNGKFRMTQVSTILPTIINDRNRIKEEANRFLKGGIAAVSMLSLLLLGTILYVQKQKRHIAASREELGERNEELQQLNDDLRDLNHRLDANNLEIADTNTKLLQSNQKRIKYIGKFLEMCALHIHKMQHMRDKVLVRAKRGKPAELIDYLQSPAFYADELTDFYRDFDEAFLNLYPEFVEQFNALLDANHQIVLEDPRVLTTELRIFALIRINISESKKIAEFLNYAPNTIYNYRAKLKKYALDKDTPFEDQVMEIK